MMTALITDQQKQQYAEEGYFLLENVIPPAHLTMLREECQRYIEQMNAEMDRLGVDVLGINHRDKRYFISKRYKESGRLSDFLFSDLMAEICRATLGDNAYLFLEQYVVKMAEVGMKFGWHQDSGYIPFDHKPYVTCWCTLDDVTEANGTVYILPYSRAGTRSKVEHVVEEGTNDKVGYFGDDPGIPVILPAGSLAVFSSFTFHRSGANTTNNMRRIFLAQYSATPILNPDGQPRNWVEPFLQAGQNVY
jgi:ectoine hydroxylase-related dioxygenase (phytanoyl-CoA dioxygenase family)